MGWLSNRPITDLDLPDLKKMSIEHILGYTGWWRSDAMNSHLSQKPNMTEYRHSTICVVIEWPDHHCGDDLVYVLMCCNSKP